MTSMRQTKVDPDGTVRCGKCGATTLLPKGRHLKCAGCGEKLVPKKGLGIRGARMGDLFNRNK